MTALTGSTPLTALANGPAYIRIAPDTRTRLPQIMRREITGLPATYTRREYASDAAGGGNCRVGLEHAAVLAAFGTGSRALVCGDNYADGTTPRYWYFQGIRWRCAAPDQYFEWIAAAQSSAGGTGTWHYGPEATSPHHIIQNQCVYETDLSDTGAGGQRLGQFEGQYIAILNSTLVNFNRTPASENSLIACLGDDWGPLVIENNEIPFYSQSYFLGGGASTSVGVNMQDNVFSRNWQVVPGHWRIDAVRNTANAWQVQFQGSNATVVHYISGGTYGGDFLDSNYQGAAVGIARMDFMYEPATGKARRVLVGGTGNGENPGTGVITLEAAWPNPAFGTTIGVYFQRCEPTILFNSGTVGTDFTGYTDVPTATVANGSRTVTLSHQLPDQCAVGHYFYLNNLHHDLDYDWRHLPTHNGYGGSSGLTRAQCRRKQITAISGDRLTLTLDVTQDGYSVLAGEPTTFPFTISSYDGLFRDGSMVGKGAWETKSAASRMVMQGNVFEGTLHGGSNHVLTNVGAWGAGGAGGGPFTLAGDTATLSWSGWAGPITYSRLRTTYNARGWPYNDAEVVWPYAVLTTGFFARDFWGSGRIVGEYVEPDHLTVRVPVSLNEGAPSWRILGDGTYPYYIATIGSPWWTIRGFTYAYNLGIAGGTGTSVRIANAEESGEVRKGRWADYHDNLVILANDPIGNFGGTGGCLGLAFPAEPGAGPFGRYSLCTGDMTGDTSYTRWAHNTIAHAVLLSGQAVICQIDLGEGVLAGQVYIKSHDVDLVDNLVTGINAYCSPLSSGSAGNPANISSNLDLESGTVRFARNVLIGSQAAAAFARAPNDINGNPVVAEATSSRFPDNVALAAPDAAGFAGHYAVDATAAARTLALQVTSGLLDPMDVTPYQLTDIYATGTVTLAANGLSATLASGTFPSTVVPGAFFKTTTNGTLCRITSGGNGSATVTWTTPAHPEAGQGGKSYAITFKGTATDGTDPGANLSLVEQFTRNVRTRAIP